ncbi:polyprenyl diphosphate synthase [Streptomyces gamaensis]|uniref:Isoprenyl transferase n=1 Tax=Streptomyces gamaensis TaxID=1763542 RepID=A0ABW0YWY8_9ACTN
MSLTTDSDRSTLILPVTEQRPVVRHLALILDGNRRWARTRGLPARAGYERGGARVLELLSWCRETEGLDTVTLWPLSVDNLRRPHAELTGLYEVIGAVTERIAALGHWRIRLIGAPDALPGELAARLRHVAREAGRPAGPVVNIAVAYSGRDEIARAVRNLVHAHHEAGTLHSLAGGVAPEEIAHCLDTSGQPDPDLVIRTSGEQRLSGFMPWQTAYSEFFFCPAPWPDFDRREFERALRCYRARHRRLGL